MTTNDTTTPWLDAVSVSKALDISVSKLRTMARLGQVPSYRIGTSYKFNKQEIMDWLQDQRIQPAEK